MIEQKGHPSMNFALVKNLRGKALEIAKKKGIKSGLVVVKTEFVPGNPSIKQKIEVIRVKGTPTKFIREYAKKNNIALDDALKKAYNIK